MSETQLSNKKDKAEKILDKLEIQLTTDFKPRIADLDRFIVQDTGIEEPEKVTSLRNWLIEEEIVKVDGDQEHGETEITGIDRNQLIDNSDSHQPLLEKDFDSTIYREVDSKQELAQEYANWLIEEANIVPVWIGSNGKSTTIFYRYNPLNHTWSEVQIEMIRKKAKKDLQTDYNKNMKQEIKNQLTDHYKYIEFEEMGLPENEVLLKEGKILNLETCETREVEKSDYALNCLNAKYDSEAEAEELQQFINRTIDNEDMVKTLQEYIGYTLTWPNNKYEKMLLILGNTDTGKSTLLQVIEKLFEESNLTKLSFPQIGMDRAFHIKDLKDSVLNIDSDMDDQAIKRKSRVKKVVSKEEVFVEPKGDSGFTMTPRANFIVTSNDAPDDAGATDAYYNRFLTLTATNRVSEKEKDRELVEKLTSDESMDWLLSWAIEGLQRLQEQNCFTCNRTEYETKKIWDRFGNSVQKFISEQITLDREEGDNIPTTDLYETYKLWCETELEQEVTRQKFIAQAASHPDLTKRKTDAKDGSRRMCFVDIEVKDFAV